MLIEELSAGQNITIIAIIGNEQLTFETTITESYPKKHIVLAAPIYNDEKIVTFRTKNLRINISTVLFENTPYLFKNVTVSLMRKPDDSLCYAVSSTTEGKVNNRRQNFRCFLGIETVLQCGSNHATHNAIFRDISMGGFSVTCDASTDFQENQILHVLLKDYFEDLAEKYSFHLYGIIVRRQELENNRIIYGCRLNSKVPGLEAYIIKKERMQLKKQAGGVRNNE